MISDARECGGHTYGPGMAVDSAPVVDQANNDEHDDEDDFDHGEPVLGFSCDEE